MWIDWVGVIIGAVGAATCLVMSRVFDEEHELGVPGAGAWLAGALAGFTLFMFILTVAVVTLAD